MEIYDNEVLIDVKTLNIDSASFTEIVRRVLNKKPAEVTTQEEIKRNTEETSSIAKKALEDEEPVTKEDSQAANTAADGSTENRMDTWETDSTQTAGTAMNLNFGEDSQLLWPVDGNVLMSYSMDKTVYFSTLDQYRYNPAMIISGAVNDNVIAAAPGLVKSIDNFAQTGITVTLDMGNGYECMYGQLKEVQCQKALLMLSGEFRMHLQSCIS